MENKIVKIVGLPMTVHIVCKYVHVVVAYHRTIATVYMKVAYDTPPLDTELVS